MQLYALGAVSLCAAITVFTSAGANAATHGTGSTALVAEGAPQLVRNAEGDGKVRFAQHGWWRGAAGYYRGRPAAQFWRYNFTHQTAGGNRALRTARQRSLGPVASPSPHSMTPSNAPLQRDFRAGF